MLIASILNTLKCRTRIIGAFQQRPVMCVPHHWKLWLQHRKASQFAVGRMNTSSSDTLASQASAWTARVGYKFQVDLCKYGVSAGRHWNWFVVSCGPRVLVRPQLPHVFFVQTKMMLLQKHREKKRIIVDVVLAVMEACLQSEWFMYMSVWNKAAKIPIEM